MDFVEVIEQAKALLQSKGRVTYRVLKRQFVLDEESLEDLKEQLIEAEELAIDKDGKMLVWVGDGETPPEETVTQTADAPAPELPASAPSPQPESEAPIGERRQLGEELLDLAAQRDETPLSVIAHYVLGLISYHLGELLSARHHLEESIACYTPVQRSSPLFRAGIDPGVACHLYAAWTLWSLGYPDQALARAHDGLALATELAHPFSSAYALTHAAQVYQFRREGQEASDHAATAITLSTEQGFVEWLAMGTIMRGGALTTQGQGEEGLRQMRQGLTDFRATGAELNVPYFLLLLAEGHASLGQVEAGLAVLQEGWEVMERTGEHAYQAEMSRLKGALLLQQQGQVQAEAEACFQQAIEIAQQQSAKSWELRAVMSLARLWQQQGKTAEARDLLVPVYEWFTEGFDTADLKEAKVLLEQLL